MGNLLLTPLPWCSNREGGGGVCSRSRDDSTLRQNYPDGTFLGLFLSLGTSVGMRTEILVWAQREVGCNFTSLVQGTRSAEGHRILCSPYRAFGKRCPFSARGLEYSWVPGQQTINTMDFPPFISNASNSKILEHVLESSHHDFLSSFGGKELSGL